MKILIIIFILLPIVLFAQDNNNKAVENVQLKEAMAQISSNPTTREVMLRMILEKTKDSKEEMTKFGKIIMDYPAMKSIITSLNIEKAKTFDTIIEPRKMMKDSTKEMKMSGYKEDPGK